MDEVTTDYRSFEQIGNVSTDTADITERLEVQAGDESTINTAVVNLVDDSYLEYLERLEEVNKFIEYLKERALSEEGNPSYGVALQAENLWLDISSDFQDLLPVPLVSLGPEGNVLFTIRDDALYLEMEVTEEGIEIFYEEEGVEYSVYEFIESRFEVMQKIEPLLLQIID